MWGDMKLSGGCHEDETKDVCDVFLLLVEARADLIGRRRLSQWDNGRENKRTKKG
jgi:hypothetical protein